MDLLNFDLGQNVIFLCRKNLKERYITCKIIFIKFF
jgi:hypothetical protein